MTATRHPESETTDVLAEALFAMSVDTMMALDYDDVVTVVTEQGDTFQTPRDLVDSTGEFATCEDCGHQFAPDLALTHIVPGSDLFCAICAPSHP